MGIKTQNNHGAVRRPTPLKNLPTTWGLRLIIIYNGLFIQPLKNLPTTWGLRLSDLLYLLHE